MMCAILHHNEEISMCGLPPVNGSAALEMQVPRGARIFLQLPFKPVYEEVRRLYKSKPNFHN